MSWLQARPMRLPLFLFEYIFFRVILGPKEPAEFLKRAERRWRYFHFQEAKHGNYFVFHIIDNYEAGSQKARDERGDHEYMNL